MHMISMGVMATMMVVNSVLKPIVQLVRDVKVVRFRESMQPPAPAPSVIGTRNRPYRFRKPKTVIAVSLGPVTGSTTVKKAAYLFVLLTVVVLETLHGRAWKNEHTKNIANGSVNVMQVMTRFGSAPRTLNRCSMKNSGMTVRKTGTARLVSTVQQTSWPLMNLNWVSMQVYTELSSTMTIKVALMMTIEPTKHDLTLVAAYVLMQPRKPSDLGSVNGEVKTVSAAPNDATSAYNTGVIMRNIYKVRMVRVAMPKMWLRLVDDACWAGKVAVAT